jgi:hypothetical protein
VRDGDAVSSFVDFSYKGNAYEQEAQKREPEDAVSSFVNFSYNPDAYE